jgi:hypothetical protein
VIGDDAFGGEMEMIRTIREDEELAAFARTLREELLQAPTGAAALAMPVRLAEVARGSADIGVTVRSSENGGHSHAVRPRLGTRFRRPLLRIAVAVAAIPLLFTGLAFAGVELPNPASHAFESIGIELPNQGADDDTSGAARDGDSAGSETGQENSAGKLGHGKTNPNPARSEGGAEGEQGKGRALGERDLAPGPAETPGSQGEAGVKPVLPPTGPPESPGNSLGKGPDGVPGSPGSAGETGEVAGEVLFDPPSGGGAPADIAKP